MAAAHALAFRCAYCGAGPHRACRTSRGAARPVHQVRKDRARQADAAVAEWNSANPVGTQVVAYPGLRPDDPVAASFGVTVVTGATRTRAWIPEGMAGPVVMVMGYGSWIQLSHVDVVEGF